MGGRKSKAFAYAKLHHPPKAHRFLPGQNMESSHFCVKYWGGGATNLLLPCRLTPVLLLLGQEQLLESYSITLRVNKQLGSLFFSNSGAKWYPAPHPLPEKCLHYLWLKVQPRPGHTRRETWDAARQGGKWGGEKARSRARKLLT